MSQNNLISVIIPVYNQASELEQSLASLLLQSYTDYEVIIVNDGSTDGTAKIIDAHKHIFWDKQIRFKAIQQANRGACSARNRGFTESRGDYVIFWDGDVIATREMLGTMKDTLDKNPEASYAYSSFVFGQKKFRLWPFNADKLKQMPYIHSTSLIRRKHCLEWDVRLKRLQDWDLWLGMLAKGYRGVWIEKYLFTVITDSGKISNWLPKAAYKVMPWTKEVKNYKKAVETIQRKHQITNNKTQRNFKL